MITGAGVSTGSGIPDYRGPDSPARTPMTYQQFIADADYRRHYWARNHLGWRHMEAARPNTAHRVLAGWERRGLLAGIITQNVDLLHLKAGSRTVVELHGNYAAVVCLDCRERLSRWELHHRLTALNPGFHEEVTSRGAIEVAPDADAVLQDTSDFVVADCPACGGVLKPDIVYFGENVPRDRVMTAERLVDSAELLLTVGSTLTVASGFRLVRRAAAGAIPVAVVNRGRTRAHDLADLTVDGDCVGVLTGVDRLLAAR